MKNSMISVTVDSITIIIAQRKRAIKLTWPAERKKRKDQRGGEEKIFVVEKWKKWKKMKTN